VPPLQDYEPLLPAQEPVPLPQGWAVQGAGDGQKKNRKISMTPRLIVDIRYQETIMNKDQIKGRIKEAKGKVKEVTGKIVSDKTLEEKGKIQRTIGKVQAGYGDLKDDLKKGN
jgi:uncharacterized protein YjbJ (UPF0337 family)